MTLSKNAGIYTVIVALWALCVLYFSPRLFALLVGPGLFIAKILLFAFILIQIIFWFYIFFHSVIIAFSYLVTPPVKTIATTIDIPFVALLYTTCNDFHEEAAKTHLRQD